MSKKITIEYIGPHRPPWTDRCPVKIVTYFDDVAGIDKKANLQFILLPEGKGKLCICKGAPEDAAYKITSSSPAFIEFVEGTKYTEKRIIGLKPKTVNKEANLEEKLAKAEKELEEERKKNVLAAQQSALERESQARENASSSAPDPEVKDVKDTEKKELGISA